MYLITSKLLKAQPGNLMGHLFFVYILYFINLALFLLIIACIDSDKFKDKFYFQNQIHAYKM